MTDTKALELACTRIAKECGESCPLGRICKYSCNPLPVTECTQAIMSYLRKRARRVKK